MKERSPESFFFYGSFGVSAVFILAGWLWAWSALHSIRSPLILHFSDYTGINQIGGMGEVHGLGITGLLMAGLNFLLAQALQEREPRWAGILAGATLFLAILLFIALAAIISVNQ